MKPSKLQTFVCKRYLTFEKSRSLLPLRVSVNFSTGPVQEGAKSSIGGALRWVEVGEGHGTLARVDAAKGNVPRAQDEQGELGRLPVVGVEPIGMRGGVDEVVRPVFEMDTVDGTGLEHNVVVVNLFYVIENTTRPPWQTLKFKY